MKITTTITENFFKTVYGKDIIENSLQVNNNNINFMEITTVMDITAPRQQTMNILDFYLRCKIWAYREGYTIREFGEYVLVIADGTTIIRINNNDNITDEDNVDVLFNIDMVFKACIQILEL